MSSVDEQESQLRQKSACQSKGSHRYSHASTRSYLSKDSGVSMRSNLSKETMPDLAEVERESVGQVACDACFDPAVKKCLTCMDSYCVVHVRDHYTREYAGHRLQDLHHHAQCLQQQYVPPPGKLQFVSVQPDSVSLRWSSPEGAHGPHSFSVTWTGGEIYRTVTVARESLSVTDLTPGERYHFTVATLSQDGCHQSTCVDGAVYTVVPSPENLQVEVNLSSANLKWTKLAGVNQATYLLEIFRDHECIHTVHRDSCHHSITDLQVPANYTINLSTVLRNGRQSKPTYEHFSTCITGSPLTDLLQELGLKRFYPGKLTLSSVLQVGKGTVTDDPAKSTSSLAWMFLKRLMMANVTARSVKLDMSHDHELDQSDTEWEREEEENATVRCIHPLDIVTALYLCSDPFLQQEIALKMSLCQFCVPFLLPQCDTKHITFMLWAMRDIVKGFRSHSLTESREFVEERIVGLNLPMVSFVRLGKSSLSKSHTLNMLLSNPQQYHDIFFHRNMESGDALRIISNGLVDISWYLPCGTESIDVFPEPIAVSNMRGDISEFETQFCFLCETSAAIFVFIDHFDTNYKMLQNLHSKAQLFLVSNVQISTRQYAKLKACAKQLNLKPKNVILKDKKNDTKFIESLRSVVKNVITNSPNKMTLDEMTTVSNNLGILVDEERQVCQTAKRNANEITLKIKDIQQFKKEELPLQGDNWRELSDIEKEMCRLRQVGNLNASDYTSSLRIKVKKLRERQRRSDMSMTMACFSTALCSSGLERAYFLKWMRMNLDSLSNENLTALREQYKEKYLRLSENTVDIAELDKKISESSLGIEHFLREIGQLYESAVSLPEAEKSHEQMLPFPKHCAELLLEGLPIELVDGDASNIPMRWIKDVLTQLNEMVKPNNKVKVVTVLGVQSTGKSTLLNTMFGVQFAVSSGRCTRGAFMVLIRLKDDMKKELKCDFLLIIDTEGLKSLELAKLAYSYEHDNELATLVVGLSDVTIINIAMENSTEMKDVLQIVVHAFLRMKDVGKRPRCLFVHQNVPGVSAHAKNAKHRKIFLEQLNEMTQAASRMENKENNWTFTDVMKYDPETDHFYIPGLWHGAPPMAPVSAFYCEAVYELKKSLITVLQEDTSSRNTVLDFYQWAASVWKAVKFENFIFSFRNSLVADAYTKVCTEFSKWEWKFRKDIHEWVRLAETRISNFGRFSEMAQESDVKRFLFQLTSDVQDALFKGEKHILENIASYYKNSDCHVELIEQYRADFVNSATSVRKELNTYVTNRINGAASQHEGMIKLELTKKNHSSVVEERVLKLLEDCRRSRSDKSEEELKSDFEKIWVETIHELSFKGLKKQDIMASVYTQIWTKLNQKGSSVAQNLANVNLNDYGLHPKRSMSEWMKKNKHLWNRHANEAQEMADNLIANIEQLVAQYTSKDSDYDDTYTIDILNKIDEAISTRHHTHFKISEEFVIFLTLHICAHAAREFQNMHDRFLKKNDLRRCLEESKEKYWTDFKDIFHDRDQSQRKADEFTSSCLKPAIKRYLSQFLGQDIVDEVLDSKSGLGFSSRTSFQYSVLKQMLEESNFSKYYNYINFYERFVKNLISEQIKMHCSDDSIVQLEHKRLRGIVTKIKESIYKAQEETRAIRSGNLAPCRTVDALDVVRLVPPVDYPTDGTVRRGIERIDRMSVSLKSGDPRKHPPEGHAIRKSTSLKGFINNMCLHLKKHLAIPSGAFMSFMALNTSRQEPFVKRLLVSLDELELELQNSFKEMPIESKLESADIRPQDELFRKVIGCGCQCPFCGAPCEAGCKEHKTHFASIHRPQGLSAWFHSTNRTLEHDICSSLVLSEKQFRNPQNGQSHPYSKYMDIYPDWHIPPDSSIEASDYWKYVMTTFNERFAEEYKVDPACIPNAWKDIKKENANQVLKEYYNMK